MTGLLDKYRHQKRLNKIEAGLADGFTLMANAMKAGLGFSQALQMASTDAPWPLNEEIHSILERMKLGWSLEESFLEAEARLKIPDFSLMVQSILILRQIGGNFVAHFENLSRILRERERVSAKVRLLTAQGLSQGVILGLLPLVLGLALFFLSPEFVAPLWQTPLGWIAMVLILALDAGGYLWMKKMSKVEI
ncbi:MAG: type II secretion system F family protein [Deltaproteobacteria bacterium]|nr:type II secretion system F family protein [Deltaproteobacteria bacterium]